MSDVMQVEAVYAERGRVWRVVLTLPPASTAADALGVLARECPSWPAAALAPAALAVYGRVIGAEDALRHGDRLELLRALPTDPKRARRVRAVAPKEG